MAVVENKTQVDDQFVKEKEAAFLEFIQAKGLKTTRQRSTIVQVFFRLRGHISVEELPSELADALVNELEAQTFFDSLPASYQKQYILWIATAKKPETRRRRTQEAIEKLKRGERLGLK